ncbi:MAG: hypothetical protein ABI411_00775 [Tahibacter sp.]
MGAFSIFHWIIVLFLFGIPLLIVLLVARTNRRGAAVLDPQQRLRRLDRLKANGQVSESEYRQQRARILGQI